MSLGCTNVAGRPMGGGYSVSEGGTTTTDAHRHRRAGGERRGAPRAPAGTPVSADGDGRMEIVVAGACELEAAVPVGIRRAPAAVGAGEVWRVSDGWGRGVGSVFARRPCDDRHDPRRRPRRRRRRRRRMRDPFRMPDPR